jgi:hypothetical protein
MQRELARGAAISAGLMASVAIAASLLWHVPYIYSMIGQVLLGLFGYVITLDEDLPGGWAPIPGGARSVLLRLLAILVFLALLVTLAVMVPSIRSAGGA